MIAGHEITRVCFDYAAVLMTDQGAELRLGTGFTLRVSSAAESQRLDPGMMHSLDVVRAFLRQRVARLEIDASGTIQVETERGAMITCSPDPLYEAWSLALASGELFVCGPGGDVVRWREDPSRGS